MPADTTGPLTIALALCWATMMAFLRRRPLPDPAQHRICESAHELSDIRRRCRLTDPQERLHAIAQHERHNKARPDSKANAFQKGISDWSGILGRDHTRDCSVLIDQGTTGVSRLDRCGDLEILRAVWRPDEAGDDFRP